MVVAGYLNYVPVSLYEYLSTLNPPNLTTSPYRSQVRFRRYRIDSGPTPADPVIWDAKFKTSFLGPAQSVFFRGIRGIKSFWAAGSLPVPKHHLRHIEIDVTGSAEVGPLMHHFRPETDEGIWSGLEDLE